MCTNKADVPMADADDIVIEALLDDVLDESMIGESIDEALRLLQADGDAAGRLRRSSANWQRSNRSAAVWRTRLRQEGN